MPPPRATSVGNCGFTVLLYRCLRCVLQVNTHVLTTFFIAKTDTLTDKSIREGGSVSS